MKRWIGRHRTDRRLSVEERENQEEPDAHTLMGESERLSKKSAGWMPWHWEPKKDVTSCDKLR